MKYLQKGDKVRILATGEGASILKVLSPEEAIVDTFDGELKIKPQEVTSFVAADSKGEEEPVKFMVTAEKPKKKKEEVPYLTFDQEKRSKFSYTLDLHAEKLIGDVATKSNEEILSIQLSRLRKYLEEAVELRIQRVYIIHGIGSGRLKQEVHSILQNQKGISGYSNDYHPQYGMGATEARLR